MNDPHPDMTDPDVQAFEEYTEERPCSHALAAVYRALGHPARLEILRSLARREQACCGEIVDILPLAQSTVSQHLQVLKDAGLLVCATKGRSCHYRLNMDVIRSARDKSNRLLGELESGGCCGGSSAGSKAEPDQKER